MRTYRYTIILHPEPEEGGYSVPVPMLPGCLTQGETVEECIERAKEAIALHIEALIETGHPVPEEPEGFRAVMVEVDV